MIQLRDYQARIAGDGLDVLRKYYILILSMEVRTGKTFTAMEIARMYGAKNVLFVTKKKAIPSIKADYELLDPGYELTVINYESLHKVPNGLFDLVIGDESHSFGAFPKPSKRTKLMKEYVGGLPLILLSGTLTPESFSQIYHQMWLSDYSPWSHYRNFYAWAKSYVSIYEKWIAGRPKKFYEKANKDKVMADIKPYIISFTQSQAGFQSLIQESVVHIDMPKTVNELFKQMEKDSIVITDRWAVAASNAADRINKMAQICGGTLKVDDSTTIEISSHKAMFIKTSVKDKKIAIFYKYQAEKVILERIFPDNTGIPEDFNNSDIRYFLGQVQSIREGVNLKAADVIVMYNIDFSATSYYQARARLQSKERDTPANVMWVFYAGGIEDYVYKAVQSKKNFTASYYKKQLK